MNIKNILRGNISSLTYIFAAAVSLVMFGGFFVSTAHAAVTGLSIEAISDTSDIEVGDEVHLKVVVTDDGQEPTSVSTTTPITLTTSSDTGEFSDANASECTSEEWSDDTISLSLSDGWTQKRFCYRDLSEGTPTLTVSADNEGWEATFELTVQEAIDATIVGGDTYDTIQDAVDAASADDIIELESGTYNVSSAITVDKDITIRAAEGESPVVESTVDSYQGAFQLNADGATLEGIQINTGTDLTNPVAVLIRADNVTVQDLVVNQPADSFNSAIQIVDARSNVQIRNNTVTGGAIGLGKTTDSTVSGNVVRDVKAEGIFSAYGDGQILTLVDNEVTNYDLVDGGAMAVKFMETLDTLNGETGVTEQVKAFLEANTGIENIHIEGDNWNIHNETSNTYHFSIEDAINAATDGDTILVGSGTYEEDILVSKAVTLESTDGAENTTIIGQGDSHGAMEIMAEISDVTLRGFTIKQNTSGHALSVETGGTEHEPNRNLVVEDNVLVAADGGFALFAGYLENSTFEGNTFYVEDGASAIEIVYVGGERSYGPDRSSVNVDFIDNTFSGDADRSGQPAGAIEHEAHDSHITGNDFSGVTTNQGVVVETFGTNVVLSDNKGVVAGETVLYNQIQTAVNAATAGDTLQISEGTYNEHITINKELTLEGAGDTSSGTVIHASGSGDGIEISANNVTLKDLRVEKEGVGHGIEIVGTLVTNVTFDGITITGAVNGLRIGSGTTVDGLTIEDSHFDGNEVGWYFSHESAQGTTVTNVTITNSSFNNNTRKGIYVEKLENAVFDDIEVIDSGTDSSYKFNNGIDLNLKWAAYQNIQIRDSVVSGSGLMGTGSPFDPAGITIKARDDGGYGSPAASLSGVTLTNVAVSGGVVGIRIGEAGKGNAGPSGVTIVSSKLQGTGGIGLANVTQSHVTAVQNYWGTSSTDSADIESHLEGNDITYAPWYVNASRTVLSTSVSGNTVDSEEDVELDEGGEEGEAELPSGTSEVQLAANKVLKVSSGVKATSTVKVGGQDQNDTQNVGGTNVKVTKAVKLQSGVEGQKMKIKNKAVTNAEVELEDETTIYAPDEWDGNITPPTQSTGSGNAPSGFSVGDSVIEVGSPNSVLIFDKAATLTLSGVTGSVGYKPSGSNTWTEITTTCSGTYNNPGAPSFPGECKISDGNNTKIVTYHFTQFGQLNETSSGSRQGSFAPSTNVVVTPTPQVAPQGQVLGTQTTYQFTRNLAVGSRGADVSALQQRLINEGVYPEALVTGYYGPLTEAAVRRYQAKYGISQVGVVGPITRGQLNQTQTLNRAAILAQIQSILEEIARIQAIIDQM